MDLKETKDMCFKRHPWETARLEALHTILTPRLFEGMKILDVGCGDGFVSRNLFNDLQTKQITAVDLHLTDEWMIKLGQGGGGIRFQRDLPEKEAFDLMLLLDVIEHVEDDESLLADLVSRYLPGKGLVMITVPAFQSLYSRHDAFLGHYRRYRLKELARLTTACGLEVVRCGYLFCSLLLPKLVFYKFLRIANCSEGVGHWRGGVAVTRLLGKLLQLDNNILIAAGRNGVKIPGLTGWVLCQKRV